MKENERRAIAWKGEALPHNGEAEPQQRALLHLVREPYRMVHDNHG